MAEQKERWSKGRTGIRMAWNNYGICNSFILFEIRRAEVLKGLTQSNKTCSARQSENRKIKGLKTGKTWKEGY